MLNTSSVEARVMINAEGLIINGEVRLWDGSGAIDIEQARRVADFLMGIDKQHENVKVGQLLSDRIETTTSNGDLTKLLAMVDLCEWWPNSDSITFTTPVEELEQEVIVKDIAGRVIANAREEVVGVVDLRPAQLCTAIVQGALDIQHAETLQEIIIGVPESIGNVAHLLGEVERKIGNDALFEDYADGGFEVLPLRGAGFHVVVAQLGEFSVQTGGHFADLIEEFCF